jgi:hypothetical protein
MRRKQQQTALYGLRRWREVGKIDLTNLAACRDPI